MLGPLVIKFWYGKCQHCTVEYWAKSIIEPYPFSCQCDTREHTIDNRCIKFSNPKEAIPVDGVPPDLTDQVENAVISIANSLDKIQQRLELALG